MNDPKKTWWREKKRVMITNTLSFSHIVFHPSQNDFNFSVIVILSSSNAFNLNPFKKLLCKRELSSLQRKSVNFSEWSKNLVLLNAIGFLFPCPLQGS